MFPSAAETMKSHILKMPVKYAWPVVSLVVVTAAIVSHERWWPQLNAWVRATAVASSEGSHAEEEAEDPHAGHDHGAHAGHNEATSLEMSEQAMRNLGLVGDGLKEVQFTTFTESITVPALVVERPGRTRIQVATPMTGVITDIHAEHGEAVEAGSLLFEIQLTHEDLVRAQTEFVKNLGELDIERREITRLKAAAESGGIARKTLLERQYASDKLKSLLAVQREGLRLHGLSAAQVDLIERDRRLLRALKIFSPNADGTSSKELRLSRARIVPASMKTSLANEPPLILRELHVHRGEAVDAGQPLATIVNYSELFIEGMSFEQDVPQLAMADQNHWPVLAVFENADGSMTEVRDLSIAYLDTEIDATSRTMKFFVKLPNKVTQDRKSDDGLRIVNWRYRPGQRLQLRVPVKQWEKQIVLPIDAVAQEGAEYFVFQQNGDHFDRLPVHVKYRDQYSVVVANDGQLFPGDVVAMRGAHQLQMALKNKSGGGVDPHAGHNH